MQVMLWSVLVPILSCNVISWLSPLCDCRRIPLEFVSGLGGPSGLSGGHKPDTAAKLD